MNKKIHLTRKAKLIILFLLAAAVVFSVWQNNDLTVSDYEYESQKVSAGLSGYKIVQISDLHNKMFGKNQKRLLDAVKVLEPDIIVITGDIVDRFHTDIENALVFVRGAVELAPVYYVNGNHEICLSTEELDELYGGMREAGVIILNNQSKYIGTDDTGFYLVGVNDPDNGNSDILMSLTAQNSSDEKLNILLAHEPQYVDYYSRCGADIVLCGHAHGGQVRLPFIGGLVAPGQGWFPKYTSGEYAVGNTTMIVSRGLGNSIAPIRVFNRPEIVSVTLKAPA